MISVTFIRTIISYFCGYVLGWGIIGIWMGVLGDQVSRFVFATVRFRQGKWVKIKSDNRSLIYELPLTGGVTDFLRLCCIACQQSV